MNSTSNGQTEVLRAKPHWFPYLFIPLFFFIVGVLALLIFNKEATCAGISGILVLVGLILGGVAIPKYQKTEFILSGEKISGKSNGQDINIAMSNVDKAEIISNPLINAIGYCSIVLYSGQEVVTFMNIGKANQVIPEIKKLLDGKVEITSIRKK